MTTNTSTYSPGCTNPPPNISISNLIPCSDVLINQNSSCTDPPNISISNLIPRSKVLINQNSSSTDIISDKYSACTCNWKCNIRGCYTYCKKIVNNINKGQRKYNIPEYKNTHCVKVEVLIEAHLWGLLVKPNMCPYQETNCYIWHIANHHTASGCKKELNNEGYCKFRCLGCNRVIMPNAAFINHSKNHPEDDKFNRIRWKNDMTYRKDIEKKIKQQAEIMDEQKQQINILRKQIEEISAKVDYEKLSVEIDNK